MKDEYTLGDYIKQGTFNFTEAQLKVFSRKIVKQYLRRVSSDPIDESVLQLCFCNLITDMLPDPPVEDKPRIPPGTETVTFGDYDNYPPSKLLRAARFRDEHCDESDRVYAIEAKKAGLVDELAHLVKWEHSHAVCATVKENNPC